MPKKYSTSTTLVIVESPAKCKKIEEYLGPGYKCVATYGHLRTISSLKDIVIENNFNPTYTIIDSSIKKKQIEFLRNEIKNADEVIICSDNDREGEMIGFSIIELFKLPLNTKRVAFNEITESAIQCAIKNPKCSESSSNFRYISWIQSVSNVMEVYIKCKRKRKCS